MPVSNDLPTPLWAAPPAQEIQVKMTVICLWGLCCARI
jgi:hypothetical protein